MSPSEYVAGCEGGNGLGRRWSVSCGEEAQQAVTVISLSGREEKHLQEVRVNMHISA